MKKRALSLLLALVMCLSLLPTAVYADDESDFTIEDGRLTKYTGSGGDVTIPDGVTSIGHFAFSDCSSLTSVTIPDGVKSIGYAAFGNCSGLTSVTIPSSVTSIEYSAFLDCTSLTSVTIPGSVTSIDGQAFLNCTNLTSVTIQEGVASIERSAFHGCTSLTGVTIPSSASIGRGAFGACTSLTSVTILDGATSIGVEAFVGCTSLTSVTIPSSVSSIGNNAFYRCAELKDVYFGGTKAQWNAVSLQSGNDYLSKSTIHCSDGDVGDDNTDSGNSGSSGTVNDVLTFSEKSFNQTITSGTPANTANFTTTWKSPADMKSAKVQKIDWAVSDTSVVTLNVTDSEASGIGIAGASVIANPGLTKDKTVTVTATATYTLNGKTLAATASADLTVKAQPADVDTPKVTVSPTTVNLAVGEKVTVTATLTGVKNYSDYRMNWQNIYTGVGSAVPFTVSGVTKQDSWTGYSSFDSQGHATITITGSTAGSVTFFSILYTSAGKQVNYEGNDGSGNVTVTVSKPITVSFSSAGGSSVPSKTVNTNQTYGELPIPTREGYVFDGWYTSSYGGSKVTDSTTVTATSNHTLYAHWTKMITVRFDSDGGSSVPDKTVAPGQPYGELPTPTREGYVFDGWYASRYSDAKVTGSTTVIYEYDHTLYARWIEADGKLTVSPNSVSFDKVQEGYAQPNPRIVTVENAGEGEITLSQPTSDAFELSALSQTSLAPNATATFTVCPKAGLKAGTYTDVIFLKSADGKTLAFVAVSFTVEEKTPEFPEFPEFPDSGFIDVPANAWYAFSVNWAVAKGITKGTSATTFSPNITCTHVEIVTFLYRAAGSLDAKATAPIEVDPWFVDAVNWAYGEGIIDGSFNPSAPCTRADTVTYMWKAAGSPAADGGQSFTDVPAGAAYLNAVNWAVAQGITTGTGDGSTFEPGITCDRAQIVTLLYRAYSK